MLDSRPTIGWIIVAYMLAMLAIVFPFLWIAVVAMTWSHIRRVRRRRAAYFASLPFPASAREAMR